MYFVKSTLIARAKINDLTIFARKWKVFGFSHELEYFFLVHFRPRTSTTRPSTEWSSASPTRTSAAKSSMLDLKETGLSLQLTVTSCPVMASMLD